MATADRTTKLDDDLTVSAIGFGAGALTSVYGDVDDAESLATLNRCLDLDVTLIDTANVYGGRNNERLIAKPLADRRDEVTLATKFGVASNPADRAAGRRPVRGDAAYVHQCIDESLARLQTDVVDLYYMHRRDLTVPIEETVGAMAELVRAGKVRHLGLCEVTADELRAAVAVHPIAAVQSEWSIWSRDVERKVVPTAAGLGVASVPIPGTRRASRVEENLGSLSVTLTPAQLTALDAAGAAVAGNRADDLTSVSAGRE